MDNFNLSNQTRNRAWRRRQNRRPSHRKSTACKWKAEKNWKLLYTRDMKIRRAQQLGFIYHLNQDEFIAEWFD